MSEKFVSREARRKEGKKKKKPCKKSWRLKKKKKYAKSISVYDDTYVRSLMVVFRVCPVF